MQENLRRYDPHTKALRPCEILYVVSHDELRVCFDRKLENHVVLWISQLRAPKEVDFMVELIMGWVERKI